MRPERAFTFDCAGERLVGIVHPAAEPAPRGVLIVVGGPQYRAGSHRQFVHLARQLAAAGIPAMRFDARGMGDSEGEHAGFELLGPDLKAAVDAFTGLADGPREVVLWGLCDAASAALLHAHSDPRISGLVLANPWARTEAGEARTVLRHYYLQRLFSAAFWRKLLRGEVAWGESLRSFGARLRNAGSAQAEAGGTGGPVLAMQPFTQRMRAGLARFDGRVLWLFSGQDLTAAEFLRMVSSDGGWDGALEGPKATVRRLPEATHTFSSAPWREQVARWTVEWLASW